VHPKKLYVLSSCLHIIHVKTAELIKNLRGTSHHPRKVLWLVRIKRCHSNKFLFYRKLTKTGKSSNCFSVIKSYYSNRDFKCLINNAWDITNLLSESRLSSTVISFKRFWVKNRTVKTVKIKQLLSHILDHIKVKQVPLWIRFSPP